MRYVKQKDKYACGPIAVLNALKWAGASAPYKKTFKRLKKLTDCTIGGSDYDGIVKAIKHYPKVFDFIENHFIEMSDIDYYIKEGASIILEYYYKDLEVSDGYVGHFVFIAGKWDNYYLVVNNYVDGEALQICSRRELRNMIKSKKTFGRDARAIVLFKKERL